MKAVLIEGLSWALCAVLVLLIVLIFGDLLKCYLKEKSFWKWNCGCSLLANFVPSNWSAFVAKVNSSIRVGCKGWTWKEKVFTYFIVEVTSLYVLDVFQKIVAWYIQHWHVCILTTKVTPFVYIAIFLFFKKVFQSNSIPLSWERCTPSSQKRQ